MLPPRHDAPAQPVPWITKVGSLVTHGHPVSAIYRKWNPGDVEHCRLCDRCNAHNDECLILIEGKLTAARGQMLDLTGRETQREAAGQPDPPPWSSPLGGFVPYTRSMSRSSCDPGGTRDESSSTSASDMGSGEATEDAGDWFRRVMGT